VEEKDHPAALTVDNVVVDAALVVDDKHDIALAHCVHDQQVEGVLLEHDFTGGLHPKFSPLFGTEAEPLETGLALLQLLFLPLVHVPPLLPLGLVRVDFTEGVLVHHHPSSRSLLEGLFAPPAELDQVSGLLHLTHFGRESVEEAPTLGEGVCVLLRGTLYGEVF